MGVPKRTRDYYVNLNNSEPSCLKKERKGGGAIDVLSRPANALNSWKILKLIRAIASS